MKKYKYVGQPNLLTEALGSEGGTPLKSAADIIRWIRSSQAESDGDSWPATYIVGLDCLLKFAPRRSEHVSCASGQSVLAAGEIFFSPDGTIDAVTNQSTGYCPDPDCFPAVRLALETAGLHAPSSFQPAFIFRRCNSCGERNLVKENYFVCTICGSDLPQIWNFE